MTVSGGKVWISDEDARALPLYKRTFYVEVGGGRVPMTGWFMLSLSGAVALVIGVMAIMNSIGG